MAKVETYYVCNVESCGHEQQRWMGKCPKCGTFSSLEERTRTTGSDQVARSGLKTSGALTPTKKAYTVKDLRGKRIHRTPTGINELDRVLGGGFVDGEVVLLAAQPGAGKSTLALAVANQFAEMGKKVLYSSGEESEMQIGLRAERMKVSNENIFIVNETNLETVLGHIEELKPEFVIVDSLQTIASTEIPGGIGGISQSKEAAITLTRIAKDKNIMMLLINQMLKES